jgi:glycerophosphoryl diester phosphodiesterase
VIHGHRGARGLAPENTLAGFACACAIGVDGVELDILISADERVAIHHDPCLNTELCRDSSGKWLEGATPLVRELTERQLKAYDVGMMRPGSSQASRFPSQKSVAGETIPMLSDLVLWWQHLEPHRPTLNIELKSDPRDPDQSPDPADYARIVVGELEKWNLLGEVWLQAFDWRVLQEIQRLVPDICTGYLSSEREHDATVSGEGESPWLAGFDPCRYSSSLPKAVRAAGGKFWGPAFADVSKDRVLEAQALGLFVHTWTLNEDEQFGEALNLGVNGITSDYPDRARAALRSAGLGVAPPCQAVNRAAAAEQ